MASSCYRSLDFTVPVKAAFNPHSLAADRTCKDLLFSQN